MWRLRSLVAMGHDATRIGRALSVSPRTARRIIHGDVAMVSPALRNLARSLWEAWWDKRPPENTPAQRRAAAAARHMAAQRRWCQPLALDEDRLDEPGYRPYSIWRPAVGTGVAPDFPAAASRRGPIQTAPAGPPARTKQPACHAPAPMPRRRPAGQEAGAR